MHEVLYFHILKLKNMYVLFCLREEDLDFSATTGIFLADEIVPPNKEKEAEQEEKLFEWMIDTKDFWCD